MNTRRGKGGEVEGGMSTRKFSNVGDRLVSVKGVNRG
jgi:hypothetical protein